MWVIFIWVTSLLFIGIWTFQVSLTKAFKNMESAEVDKKEASPQNLKPRAFGERVVLSNEEARIAKVTGTNREWPESTSPV